MGLFLKQLCLNIIMTRQLDDRRVFPPVFVIQLTKKIFFDIIFPEKKYLGEKILSICYYTDGSARGNGTSASSGGFGVVKIDSNLDNIIWEYQDFKSPTTNNEMELMAILIALQNIEETIPEEEFIRPIIYSDSAYCVNLINDWMYRWEQNGWTRPGGKEIKNLDIIKQIYNLAQFASVQKVPGHSGIKWNERADKLATGGIKL